jgi:glucokinase
MSGVTIGVDIGGTFTKFGIVDENGTCIKEGFTCTDRYKDIESFLENLHKEITKSINAVGDNIEIRGIGIGAPNGNYYKGTIEHAANLNWKGIVPLVDLMQKYFPGIHISLTNDANAAAIGEMVFGDAQEMKNFVVITLGTGLGSGIVINGELIYGHDGFAGEIGHVTVEENGRICGFGRRGSLETYVSATGIKRTAFALMADSLEPSELRNYSYKDLTSELIYKAAMNGDALALKCFDITCKYLGKAMANTVAHFSPEAIFLFGGLAKAGDLILKATKDYMEEHLLPVYKNKIKILPSVLQHLNAAVMGASALAWNELKKVQEA